jgi:hypothetical protein
MGKGCKPNEHFLRFEFDIGKIVSDPLANRYILLDEIPVNEKATVLSIKKMLFSQWDQLSKNFHEKMNSLSNKDELLPLLSNLLLSPSSPHTIRLRDYKNGKISGPLRDERMICRCLLGLSDGRRLILQILPNEEIIGSDDLLLTVRYVFYFHQKQLSDGCEMAIPRSFKVKDLYEKVSSYFPQLFEVGGDAAEASSMINKDENNYLEIAKGYTTGPPLTIKSSLKLKWELNKMNIFAPSTTAGEGEASSFESLGDTLIDRPPLNLRDGSLLVIRNHYDFLRAQEVSQAKQKEKAAAEASSDLGVGGGISAVRAKSLSGSSKRPGSSAGRYLRPGSSASSTRSMRGSSTEPVLKIMTTSAPPSAKADRPPMPGATKGSFEGGIAGMSMGEGGSPNENNLSQSNRLKGSEMQADSLF